MAKLTKRLSIKGDISYEDKTITVYDKNIGEIVHSLDDIFLEFNGLEATLTLSHDKEILPE